MELEGKRIAILVQEQYEDLEVWYPLLRLREAGAEVTIVGTEAASYLSKHGIPIQANTSAEQVQADDFDALLIPSGPSMEGFVDHPAMTTLIQIAIQQGKLVAAIASGRQGAMADAKEDNERSQQCLELCEGVPQPIGSLRDRAAIREGNLLLARLPVDLSAFCRMAIAALVEPPMTLTGCEKQRHNPELGGGQTLGQRDV